MVKVENFSIFCKTVGLTSLSHMNKIIRHIIFFKNVGIQICAQSYSFPKKSFLNFDDSDKMTKQRS